MFSRNEHINISGDVAQEKGQATDPLLRFQQPSEFQLQHKCGLLAAGLIVKLPANLAAHYKRLYA